jgi:hypothetical protein
MRYFVLLKNFLATIVCVGIFSDSSFSKENDGHKWTLVQFNSNKTFCKGEQPGRSDFTIITDPAGHEGECSLSYPDGTSKEGTFTATCTPPEENGTYLQTNYQVGGPPTRDGFQKDTNRIEVTDGEGQEVTGFEISLSGLAVKVFYREFRSEHALGDMSHSFPQKNSTGWESCGTKISRQTLTGISVGGDLDVRLHPAVSLTISGDYNDETSVVAEADCPPERRIKITAHDQLIEVPITARISEEREGVRDLLDPVDGGTEWGEWQDSGREDEEHTVRGTREPQRIKHVTCCGGGEG